MAFSLSELVHLLSFLGGVGLLLKRAAEIDRYHRLRVVLFTSILTCVVIYFLFAASGFGLGISGFDCVFNCEP